MQRGLDLARPRFERVRLPKRRKTTTRHLGRRISPVPSAARTCPKICKTRELSAADGVYVPTVTESAQLDELTLARARRGDASAQLTIILHGQQAVYSLCVALCGNEAEDLTQETFLRAFAALYRFELGGPATFRTWLLTIARRLCRDYARNRARRPLVFDSDADAASLTPGPDQAFAAARAAARVRAAVLELDADKRAVIALREWEGLDYTEIAAIEEISVGTVRSRLARARDELRMRLPDLAPQHQELQDVS